MAMVVLPWLAADGDAIQKAADPRSSATQTIALSASPTAPAIRSSPPTPTVLPPPVPMTAPRQRAGASPAVLVTASTAQTLAVGEMNDLVIGLDGNAGVREISFTVQFDPSVLQVRAGTEGDLAADASVEPRFSADISVAEDRVQIRSTVSRGRLAGAAGSVALVQYQAVAPGATSILITDVTVKDLAGNSMPFLLSSSHLQVMAESVPLPLREGPHPHEVAPMEASAPEPVDAGD